MTFDKHSFVGATIGLSAPTLKLRTGGTWVAWKEVKYIVPRSCRAYQSGRVPRPRMRTFRFTGSFQGLLGQFVILEMSIVELSKYIKNSHESSHKDLGRGNVSPCEQREVDANEFCPRGPAFALRRRRYTVTAQNITDRLIGDFMSQIGERPDDPIIAPGPIFLGHADDQSFDLSVDPRSPRDSTGSRSLEFASDEPSVPPQDGVRLGDGRHFAQCLAAQSMANLAEPHSLGV
jgi:hypothetical protein